ncbi:MAG: sigma-70 family RNA polymerase sigma factor [Prevotellaceae bacterium]|nr:sigma-70 family RNA polymerase sigma factor [Candidatus Minthosoma equi]
MYDVNRFNIKIFFKEHYHSLFLYATHIMGDADRAEDVVMDCFAKFVEKVEGGWLPNSDAKRYIYMMVRNMCIDEMKRLQHIVDIDTIGDMVDTTDDRFMEIVEQCDREARLWKAIDDLPKSRRRIFLMSKRDGLTYREIANRLGLSVKTVEKQISNAFHALRLINGK